MREYKQEIWDKLEEIGVIHPSDDPERYRLEEIEWDNTQ
jgi:hypothetical protein